MIIHKFKAMASPCEVHVATKDPILASKAGQAVEDEAKRIESKYSRYQSTSVVSQINSSKGKAVSLDEESAQLMDFAFDCYEMSDGLIDITSGVLRQIWSFKTPDQPLPTSAQIQDILNRVGLKKAKWNSPYFQLPKDMEIDLGGIVKEYAADRCLSIARALSGAPCMINFGGDISASKNSNGPWKIAIEGSKQVIDLMEGGLASSGDGRRYLKSGDRIFSHILNPKTGWAVESKYVTISVESESCTSAGILATLSHLQTDPKDFLTSQGVRFWLVSSYI